MGRALSDSSSLWSLGLGARSPGSASVIVQRHDPRLVREGPRPARAARGERRPPGPRSRTGARSSGPTCGACSPRSRATSASWRPRPARPTCRLLARTPDYPDDARRATSSAARPSRRRRSPRSAWRRLEERRSRCPAATSTSAPCPCSTGDEPLGFVVLVHDLSFVERREATTQRLPAARLRVPRRGRLGRDRRRGAAVLARLEQRAPAASCAAGRSTPEFQPILRDVRELVDRIVAEKRGATGRAAPGRRSGSSRR